MKTKATSTLLDLVRGMPVRDLIIASFLILPITLGAWNVFLQQIFDFQTTGNVTSNVILLIVYVVGLAWMKLGESKKELDRRSRALVVGKLSKFRMRSFAVLRDQLGERFTDEYFQALIEKYPEDFTTVTTKGGKPGIRLLTQDQGE